ncbi:MAG: class II fructose-bisphosphate aldolase [Candidatus Cloacimonetes bacterium]|nr:class II fructose-bisphosphate aldolase [Candidatus Cloacimonadota bacterium]
MFLSGDKLKAVFARAKKERFGIIASNVVFDSVIRATVQGYDAQRSDGLLQMSGGACKFAAGGTADIEAGASLISAMVKTIAAQYKQSGIGLHIDHATPNYFEFIRFCVENNLVSSVMIDASKEDFEENVRITREVVNLAHRHGVLVEGEIGYIKGTEDEIVSDTELYTQPEEALAFVQQTGVDLFAASVGTNHGVTKGSKVHLRLDLIKQIDDLLIANDVETGIVLHGASGLTVKQQRDAIVNGVVKINKDTRYQIDIAAAVQAYWADNADAIVCPAGTDPEDYMPDKKRFDPRKWMVKGEQRIQAAVESLVQTTGSAGRSILL